MSRPSPSADPSPAATEPPSLRFVKAQHLRRPAEFQRVYDGKVRAGDDRLLVFALRNDLGLTRIGLSVSRKHGGSVRRQRLKRLLREAFRLSQHKLPIGLDLVLIPRPCDEVSVTDIQTSLRQLTTRLVKRLPALPMTAGPESPEQPTGDASP